MKLGTVYIFLLLLIYSESRKHSSRKHRHRKLIFSKFVNYYYKDGNRSSARSSKPRRYRLQPELQNGMPPAQVFDNYLKNKRCEQNSSVYHLFMIHYQVASSKPGLTPEQRGDNYPWLKELANAVKPDGSERSCPSVLQCNPSRSKRPNGRGFSRNIGDDNQNATINSSKSLKRNKPIQAQNQSQGQPEASQGFNSQQANQTQTAYNQSNSNQAQSNQLQGTEPQVIQSNGTQPNNTESNGTESQNYQSRPQNIQANGSEYKGTNSQTGQSQDFQPNQAAPSSNNNKTASGATEFQSVPQQSNYNSNNNNTQSLPSDSSKLDA